MDSIATMFQNYIHQNFLDVLKLSPMESLTPFEITYEDTGHSEFLFIAKCSSYIYEPVKEQKIEDAINVRLMMYLEDNNLIVRFELLEIILETEIKEETAKKFLSTLLHQEKITLAILDGNNYQLIWFTNTIPFRTIRFHYKEIFEHYGVIK